MAWWFPLALMAAGTVAGGIANRNATRKQEQIANAMEIFKRQKAKEGRTAINEYTRDLRPEAIEGEFNRVKGDLTKDLDAGVDLVRDFQIANPVSGTVSKSYTNVRDAGRGSNRERVDRAISALATLGAPQEQALRNSIRFGRAAERVDSANTDADYVGNVDAQTISAVRPSAGLTMLSQLLTGAGMAGIGGGGASPWAKLFGGATPQQGTMIGLKPTGGLGLKPTGGIGLRG